MDERHQLQAFAAEVFDNGLGFDPRTQVAKLRSDNHEPTCREYYFIIYSFRFEDS